MALFASASSVESSPSPTVKKRPRSDSSQKLRQVLNYSSSVDKVCETQTHGREGDRVVNVVSQCFGKLKCSGISFLRKALSFVLGIFQQSNAGIRIVRSGCSYSV
jgi:hypothetical protein